MQIEGRKKELVTKFGILKKKKTWTKNINGFDSEAVNNLTLLKNNIELNDRNIELSLDINT